MSRFLANYRRTLNCLVEAATCAFALLVAAECHAGGIAETSDQSKSSDGAEAYISIPYESMDADFDPQSWDLPTAEDFRRLGRKTQQHVATTVNSPVEPATSDELTPLPPVGGEVPAPLQRTRRLSPQIAGIVGARLAYAEDLASRGATFAAEEELLWALQVVARAKDAQHRTDRHSAALSAAMIALEEADDFAAALSPMSRDPDLPRLISAHRTPILQSVKDMPITPIAALQEYYAYAQEQLVFALEPEPVAARTLCNLAVVQSMSNGSECVECTNSAARTIALYQAAIAVDPENSQAANELGVLLVQYGRLAQAEQILLRSAVSSSRAEPWQNLAKTYERMGRGDLAEQAEQRYLEAQQNEPAEAQSQAALTARWISPAAFVSGIEEPTVQPIPSTQPSGAPMFEEPENQQEPAQKPSFWSRLKSKLAPSSGSNDSPQAPAASSHSTARRSTNPKFRNR